MTVLSKVAVYAVVSFLIGAWSAGAAGNIAFISRANQGGHTLHYSSNVIASVTEIGAGY